MIAWPTRRVGDMAQLINGFPFESSHFGSTGDVPLVRIRDITATDFETFVPAPVVPQDKVLCDGDVVIGMDGDFNVTLWRRGAAALNQRVCALRSNGNADMRFLAYALPDHLKVINDLTYSTTVKHLASSQVTGLRLEVPEFAEQQRIADYLDRETATIDALIEKQSSLIAGLQERRRATISQAVVNGVEGTATQETTDTYFPLIGGSWSLQPIIFGFDVVLGKMLDAKRELREDDSELPYVRAANIKDGFLDLDDVNSMAFSPIEVKRLDLRSGDLLVVEGGSVGQSVLLAKPMPGWSFQKTVNRVRSRGLWSTAYLHYVLSHMRSRGHFDLICSGSTFAHLTAEKLRAIRIPVPSPGEQREIADHLDRETAKIDALIEKAERFIELAQERRAALITAAVTGQIEIPTED